MASSCFQENRFLQLQKCQMRLGTHHSQIQLPQAAAVSNEPISFSGKLQVAPTTEHFAGARCQNCLLSCLVDSICWADFSLGRVDKCTELVHCKSSELPSTGTDCIHCYCLLSIKRSTLFDNGTLRSEPTLFTDLWPINNVASAKPYY